jgi:hypothetical protein
MIVTSAKLDVSALAAHWWVPVCAASPRISVRRARARMAGIGFLALLLLWARTHSRTGPPLQPPSSQPRGGRSSRALRSRIAGWAVLVKALRFRIHPWAIDGESPLPGGTPRYAR